MAATVISSFPWNIQILHEKPIDNIAGKEATFWLKLKLVANLIFNVLSDVLCLLQCDSSVHLSSPDLICKLDGPILIRLHSLYINKQ